MTNLNLQKKALENVVIGLSIIILSTLLILLPISIVFFNNAIARILNNTNSFKESGLGFLPLTIILLIVQIWLLILWSFRYFTFSKINFPNEEINIIHCRKINIIKFFSAVGLKIKDGHRTFLYISSKDSEVLAIFKKNLLHKTLQFKCYQNTNIIAKVDTNLKYGEEHEND